MLKLFKRANKETIKVIYRAWFSDGQVNSWEDDFENLEDAKKWFHENIIHDDIAFGEINKLTFINGGKDGLFGKCANELELIEEYER